MQKTTIISHVKDGNQFIYNNIIYTKVRVSSYSHVMSKDCNTGVSLSGGEIVILSWSTNVKVEVPEVQLSAVAIGKKFKFNGREYLKIKHGTVNSKTQYGLHNNEVCIFTIDIDVEVVE